MRIISATAGEVAESLLDLNDPETVAYRNFVLDALNTFDHPIFEVHISNVHKREAFRHHSLLSAVCAGTITGLGPAGYRLAVQYFADKT